MFGIMFTTMFLSMWMSNTATASMVVPISMAVLEELYPKPEQSGTRRRASMFKERSEVDFEALVAKAKAHRSKQQQQKQQEQQQQHNGHMKVRMDPEPSESTKFIGKNIDFEMQ
jgi:di/tricarboxylate transporter